MATQLSKNAKLCLFYLGKVIAHLKEYSEVSVLTAFFATATDWYTCTKQKQATCDLPLQGTRLIWSFLTSVTTDSNYNLLEGDSLILESPLMFFPFLEGLFWCRGNFIHINSNATRAAIISLSSSKRKYSYCKNRKIIPVYISCLSNLIMAYSE